MNQNINLREYLDILKRRKIIVIIVMIICLGLGGYKTYENYMSYIPKYRSTITVRINTSKKSEKDKKKKKNNDEEDIQTDPYSTYNVALNQSIAKSYKSLVSSQNVTNIISSSLRVSESQIGSISASQEEDMAEFIDISVVNKNKQMAKKVAEKIPEAFNQELIRLVGYDCVEVVYDATDATLIPRGTDKTIFKYAGMGIVASIFLVLLAECLDTKIVTPDDVNKYWNYQLIGTIPLDRESAKGKRRKK